MDLACSLSCTSDTFCRHSERRSLRLLILPAPTAGAGTAMEPCRMQEDADATAAPLSEGLLGLAALDMQDDVDFAMAGRRCDATDAS